MKILKIIALVLATSTALSATAFAATETSSLLNANCQIQSSQTENPGVSIVACENGSRFEIKEIVPLAGSCTGSNWCSYDEHCVNGKCVSKGYFGRCDYFNTCGISEVCVSGTCKRR